MDQRTKVRVESIWLLWAFVGALLAGSINQFALDGVPHVQDEVVYQFQSRLLTELRLWEDERHPRAAYPYEFIVNEGGRRYGIFPNGWPLVLGFGTLIGLPWLVNPFLHGLTIYLGAWLASRLGGRRLGLVSAPLLALSPGLAIMASSRMSHTLCALLALAALASCLRATRARALAFGAALGGLILTRPMDGLLVALVLLPWACLRERSPLWLWVLPGVGVAATLVLMQNVLLEGDWLAFPQNAYFARGTVPTPIFEWRFSADCNSLGFGADRGCFATAGSLGHTPSKAWLNTWANLQSASALWFGTPILMLLALPAFRDSKLRPLAVATSGLFIVLVLGYSLYWYYGTSYGPRFYHLALPLVTLLLAVGVDWAMQRWRYGAVALAVVLGVFALRTWTTLPELEGYWGVDGRIAELARTWKGPSSLILVAAAEPDSITAKTPVTSGEEQRHAAFLRRGMWIELASDRLMFAEYQPALVDEMARRHADRRIYALGLSADGSNDRLIPIEEITFRPVQVRDLPLPTAVPVFQSARKGQDTRR